MTLRVKMDTPFGPISASWSSILGTRSPSMMLSTIHDVLVDPPEGVLQGFMDVPLDKLQVVIIVDSHWDRYVDPVEYDPDYPPSCVENIRHTMGRYPDTRRWREQGVLSIAFPLIFSSDPNRYRTVWKGWVTYLLESLSSLKKTRRFAFILIGRESCKLKRSISITFPVVCVESLYKLQSCPFEKVNDAGFGIHW